MSVKTEAVVSSVSTSGAPLSPLVEPHSNTSTPLVDEPQMATQRQRSAIGDDGKWSDSIVCELWSPVRDIRTYAWNEFQLSML